MHFVIAGIVSCPQYTYAVMVAQRLRESLPDFTYLKIPKRPEEWKKWLKNICDENCWYHIKSPLIWRELGMRNGKKTFVGDIDKFFDMCYDYYGVPRDALSAENFNKGEMDWFTNRTETEFFENIKIEAKKKREYRSRQICITGASCQMTDIIVMELLQMEMQKRENGLEIRLFDEPTKENKLASAANDAKYCPGFSGFGNCRVANNLREALTNIDMVIVLDCFGRKPEESLVKWLKRNRNAMCSLGKALKRYAPPHCRVIIGGPSTQPLCYNATVLASFATNLHVRNIVVVTQDLGREMLRPLSTAMNVPLKNFFCPPVWGFVGLNKFVDLSKTLQTHEYKVPGKRVNSSLPQGREEIHLRTSEFLISDEQFKNLRQDIYTDKGESHPLVNRKNSLAKATAILDLLKVWSLKQEDGNGEILCLGIYSDGTFNIPKGLYWSQPVILRKGFWVPFADFPIPRSPYINFYYLFVYSIAALYRTKIKPRTYVPPKITKKPKESNKFDFNKLVEEVGMPVIRNDEECVTYLKKLAKNELGIDLDFVDTTIKEESEVETSPPEEVKREKLYCECWRTELKQLQKMVFDRASSTEVEMDLSDNISGSEWSIINPKGSTRGSVIPSNASFQGSHRRSGHRASRNNDSKDASSSGTVCSCGVLADGSLCRCLGPPKVPDEDDKISTEHFYKEQNAQIFEDDLRDVIYADTYMGEKHVNFDPDAKEDKKGSLVKFYGKKDAIRDEQADLLMKKRIQKYERGGEESIEEEEEEEEGEKYLDVEGSLIIREESGESVKESGLNIGKESIREAQSNTAGDRENVRESGFSFTKESVNKTKFSMTREGVKGTTFSMTRESVKESGITITRESIRETTCTLDRGIARSVVSGDQEGSEYTGKSETEKSSTSLEETYIGEDTNSHQAFPTYMGMSMESSSEKDESDFGEARYKYLSELPGEAEVSLMSLQEELDAVWEKDLDEKVEEKKEEEPKWKRKIQGVPLCCLCRCIVPEGLPFCPCGASTVVEVFKKESIEVCIQSEDDISYRLEYFETPAQPESSSNSVSSLIGGEHTEEEALPGRDLPPESFSPFSPKPINKFTKSQRPLDMTKKPDLSIPDEWKELLNTAKGRVEEENVEEGEEEEEVEEEEEENDIKPSEKPTKIEEGEGEIKKDFSNLLMFLPEGIEDWRLTVQKKYREWFFQGPKVNDDSYYDIAIEEVSEDEFEIDKQLESYFEK